MEKLYIICVSIFVYALYVYFCVCVCRKGCGGDGEGVYVCEYIWHARRNCYTFFMEGGTRWKDGVLYI